MWLCERLGVLFPPPSCSVVMPCPDGPELSERLYPEHTKPADYGRVVVHTGELWWLVDSGRVSLGYERSVSCMQAPQLL